MVKTIANLPNELLVEIFSRVPLTSVQSVRSTCKKWKDLCQTYIVGKVAATNRFLGIVVIDSTVCFLRCDLQGIYRDNDKELASDSDSDNEFASDSDNEFDSDDEDGDEDFLDVSIKPVTALKQTKVSKAYHCDGIVLCVLEEENTLLVWNPYLGQRRWILTESNIIIDDFALGYDNNGNYKILKISPQILPYSIYDFDSNSWKDLQIKTDNFELLSGENCVTLKGNVYFYSNGYSMKKFLVCFDFTTESFGQPLYLPFEARYRDVILSYVRNEKLAVLRKGKKRYLEIWITEKIDVNEILWTKYVEVKVDSPSPPSMLPFNYNNWILVIVEEKQKKDAEDFEQEEKRAYVIKDNQKRYNKLKISRKAQHIWLPHPRSSCSSYVQSLLKIE